MRQFHFGWILAVGLVALVGCGETAQNDQEKFKQGVEAFKQGNYEVALEKIKPLAEKSIPDAQYTVGVIHRQGQGALRNDRQAADWFNKAAEQGHVEAQQNLGLMYAKGEGFERDWVQADKWFTIASESGKETAANNKKVIEVHMTPEMIAKANELAKEWLSSHGKQQ